jgi:phosphoribosylglycinamide formyltransferase-1
MRETFRVQAVFSSSEKAEGLLKARRAGIPCGLLPRVSGTKKIDWPRFDQILSDLGIDRLFLAGFMKVIPSDFVGRWRGRIINLHPSLLPRYPGLDSIARSYYDRAAVGATVHEVVEEVDAGKIIVQRQTLAPGECENGNISLPHCEFLVHVDEQRLVKESLLRWRPKKV